MELRHCAEHGEPGETSNVWANEKRRKPTKANPLCVVEIIVVVVTGIGVYADCGNGAAPGEAQTGLVDGVSRACRCNHGRQDVKRVKVRCR